MIGHIEGVVTAVRPGFVIVSVNGVGYKIACTREILNKLKQGEKAALWTHLAVREDLLDLYGFRGEEELRFFQKCVRLLFKADNYALHYGRTAGGGASSRVSRWSSVVTDIVNPSNSFRRTTASPVRIYNAKNIRAMPMQ